MPAITRRTALVGALGVATPAAAAVRPQRIVSLNPCIDTMLVHIAERTQIAGLSHYARDETSSTIAAVARTLPSVRESAEEIIALQPDLVLTSQHSGLATRTALARLGVAVETFGVPDTVAASQAQIRAVARATGHVARGEDLVARIDAAIAAAAPPPGRPRLRALVFQARGLSPGAGTLIDEMLHRTGFENAAPSYGVRFWGNVSLERLLADPPDVLLSGDPAPGAPTWSERLLAHPALASLRGRMRQETFPSACLYCGGPVLLQTAPLLAAAREAAWSGA